MGSEQDFSGLKVPPHSLEAERALIGAALTNPKYTLNRVQAIVQPEHFYRDAHRLIFAVVLRMQGEQEHIDPLTVHEALGADSEQVGGMPYLSGVIDEVPTAIGVERYAQIVREKATRRSAIAIAQDLAAAAYECEQGETAVDIVVRGHGAFKALLESGTVGAEPVHLGETARELVQNLKTHDRGSIEPSRVPFGLATLRRAFIGWPRALCLLGAAGGEGKTALILAEAVLIAQTGAGCLLFTLESNALNNAARIFAAGTRMSAVTLLEGPVGNNVDIWSSLNITYSQVGNIPLWFADSGRLWTIPTIIAEIRAWKSKHPELEWVAIDNLRALNLSDLKGDNDTARDVLAGQMLAALALELGIPVVLLNQLNGDAMVGDHRPTLKHLYGAKLLIPISRMALLLWRPERYGTEKTPIQRADGKEEIDTRGRMVVMCKKHNDGPSGEEVLGWEGEQTRVFDLNPEDYVTAPDYGAPPHEDHNEPRNWGT